jgi:hypothetical protein
MSGRNPYVASVQPHQFLSKEESIKHFTRVMTPLYVAITFCGAGFFILLWMLFSLAPSSYLAFFILAPLMCLVIYCISEIHEAPNLYPSKIEVGLHGLSFSWDARVGPATRLLFVSWDWIGHATYRDSAIFVMPAVLGLAGPARVYSGPCLDLFIDESTQSFDLLNCASLWANWPWPVILREGKKPIRALRIDLTAFPLESDRDKLLKYVCQHVPKERLDLSAYESPIADISYTSLWLDSLESNAQRKRSGELERGQKLFNNRYEILDKIASGGQATIYRAHKTTKEEASHQEADIVILKEFVLPVDAGIDVAQRALTHVQQEAALLQSIDNPKIVRLIETFVEDHRAYLVLEQVDGKTLRELVENNVPLPEVKVIDLAKQMCEILAYLHNQVPSIIHRDFTPDNLMQQSDGNLKLIDFNVAQRLESSATRTVVGKHCYLPPEQFRGKATPQSDLYAMGATLYFLLTAQEPEPLSPSHPAKQSHTVSQSLDGVVSRLTALDLSERYADVNLVQRDLELLVPAQKRF